MYLDFLRQEAIALQTKMEYASITNQIRYQIAIDVLTERISEIEDAHQKVKRIMSVEL